MADPQSMPPAVSVPSVISQPPRQWGPGAPVASYPDPDVVHIDPALRRLVVFNSPIRRVWTGATWAEGPAWSSQGRYLVFSDVIGNVQYRYLWETGSVSTFRNPSEHSNGNTFDFQGRQITCQHFYRRVVRWEHNGTMTVIADNYQGQPLNSPNDVVPHPDGSIWFTDPPYGSFLVEGHPDLPGGPSNLLGLVNPLIGNPNVGLAGGTKRALPTNVYRWDTDGTLSVVVPEVQVADPNGLCFSPDYRTLYVVSTGKGPGDTGPGGTNTIYAFDVTGKSVTNRRVFTDMVVDGVHCTPDGVRTDVAGNVWASSSSRLGYSGVLVFSPQGALLGRIRLPEVCANLTFGGPKRNVLFMCGSQSLYTVLLETQGAAPS